MVSGHKTSQIKIKLMTTVDGSEIIIHATFSDALSAKRLNMAIKPHHTINEVIN